MQWAPADGISPVLKPGLAQSDRLSSLGIRSWEYVGPFDASGGEGMTTEYETETQLRSLASPWPSILNSSYMGKGGRHIRWASYEEPAGSAAPHLPLGALLGGPAATRAPLAGSVAFGLCRVHNPTAALRTVDFFGSMSGRGRLYARHEASSAGVELVYEDGLISGLADAEDRGRLLLLKRTRDRLAPSAHD